MSHSRRDELELVGSTGSLVIPDPWIGVSRSIELRRDTKRETIPVPVGADSRLGEDPGAVYLLELDRVSRAISSGEALPFGRDDAVAQAAVLEAVDRSGRERTPVELDRG